VFNPGHSAVERYPGTIYSSLEISYLFLDKTAGEVEEAAFNLISRYFQLVQAGNRMI